MFHHVSFGTRDAARAKAFYDPVLAVVGMRCLAVTDKAVGYGVNDYLFSLETPVDGRPATAGNGAHVAFVARDRAVVDEFYRVALEQGGTCDGKPGLRPE